MAIQAFEMYHGAVLTKVMRTDPMPTLRLVEKDALDAWGSYRVNVDAVLHKYSTTGKTAKRSPGTMKWFFTFPRSEIASIAKHPQTFVALVCGSEANEPKGEICLLWPEEVRRLLDFETPQAQAASVEWTPGKQLRVHTTRDDCKVPRSRIDAWKVPGS